MSLSGSWNHSFGFARPTQGSCTAESRHCRTLSLSCSSWSAAPRPPGGFTPPHSMILRTISSASLCTPTSLPLIGPTWTSPYARGPSSSDTACWEFAAAGAPRPPTSNLATTGERVVTQVRDDGDGIAVPNAIGVRILDAAREFRPGRLPLRGHRALVGCPRRRKGEEGAGVIRDRSAITLTAGAGPDRLSTPRRVSIPNCPHSHRGLIRFPDHGTAAMGRLGVSRTTTTPRLPHWNGTLPHPVNTCRSVSMMMPVQERGEDHSATRIEGMPFSTMLGIR